jgi:hypothetical protein
MSIAWKAVTAEQLDRLYWRQEMTDEEIALFYGVSKDTVTGRRRRFGIPGRGEARPRPLRDRGRSLRCSGPFLR